MGMSADSELKLYEPFDLIARIEQLCKKNRIDTVTLFVNMRIEWGQIEKLLDHPRVTSVILREDQGYVPIKLMPVLGFFQRDPARWILPRQLGKTIVITGEEQKPSLPMAVRALQRGLRSFYSPSVNDWEKHSFINTLSYRTARYSALRFFNWTRNVKNQGTSPGASLPSRILNTVKIPALGEQLFFGLAEIGASRSDMAQALSFEELPLLKPEDFHAEKVLMINSALAWGGAERQLVNSMIGLQLRGLDVALVCEALNVVADSDFFGWRLKETNLEVSPIRRASEEFKNDISAELLSALADRIQRLPSPFRENLAPYALELLARRPQTVHAWQDQTNIMVGVAAVIVGVPRIILSTRNMSPPNFAYYQPHMRDSYRALLECPNLRIINNSRAGRADYATWLAVRESFFKLLHNGIDFDMLDFPKQKASIAYRKKLGIGDDKRIIGSIFRLYEEKDPFLWLDVAALVARRFPDTVFLIIGVGPLKEELIKRARENNMEERLYLPGTEKNPRLPLSIMDVFMLTSRFEGLPNVIIEAQSQGIPVVTTLAGGSAETIDSGKTGWLVKERSSEDLADRVCYILEHEEWAKKARQKAGPFAQKRFGFDRMIDETIQIYEDIIL